jgi:glycosyltransferase involved in cell wall biosynthesis
LGIKNQLAEERIDIYHGLSNELPFGKTKSYKKVVTIHDLIFLKYPEQYPFIDRQFYTAKTKYAVKNADKIIAVSNETRNDLIDLYKVNPDKIEVIYPAVDPLMQKLSPKQTPASPPYILHVGSYIPRKNQLKLIEAFALIADKTDAKLWLVGKGYMQQEISQMIAAKKLTGRVKTLSSVNNEELRVLYSLARVFVYPSINEGFGMPVVEALLSEVPVIASKGGAIEEAAGSGSLFINPLSAEDIADKMLRVLNDETLSANMIIEGLKHAATMSDKIAAEKMMRAYASL